MEPLVGLEEIIWVYVYARVSSLKQREERTIESQLRFLRDWLGRRPQYQVKRWFVEDGTTGEDLMRPELQEMFAQARKKVDPEVRHVLVLDTSRFSRKALWGEIAVGELATYDISVLYTDHPADESTAAGKLSEQMFRSVAEYMKDQTLTTMNRGKEHKLRSGHGFVSTSPFGIAYTREDGTKHGTFSLVPEEARYVQEIFARAERGESAWSIARWMSSTGVPAPKGSLWAKATIIYILHNPVYKGEHAHRRYKATLPRTGRTVRSGAAKSSRCKVQDSSLWITIAVPACVSVETWEAVQLALRGQRVRWMPKEENARRFLLRGLVQCCWGREGASEEYCNHAMGASSTTSRGRPGAEPPKPYYYYRCGNNWTDPVTFVCRRCNGRIRADKLDQTVWTYVAGLLANPERLRHILEQSTRQDREQLTIVQKDLERVIALEEQTNKKLAVLYEDRLSGDIDKATYLTKQDALVGQRGAAQQTRQVLQSRISLVLQRQGPNLANVQALIASLTEDLQNIDAWSFERRFQTVHHLVRRVEVHSNKEVSIVCALAMDDDEKIVLAASLSSSSTRNNKFFRWTFQTPLSR